MVLPINNLCSPLLRNRWWPRPSTISASWPLPITWPQLHPICTKLKWGKLQPMGKVIGATIAQCLSKRGCPRPFLVVNPSRARKAHSSSSIKTMMTTLSLLMKVKNRSEPSDCSKVMPQRMIQRLHTYWTRAWLRKSTRASSCQAAIRESSDASAMLSPRAAEASIWTSFPSGNNSAHKEKACPPRMRSAQALLSQKIRSNVEVTSSMQKIFCLTIGIRILPYFKT